MGPIVFEILEIQESGAKTSGLEKGEGETEGLFDVLSYRPN
jgi:hypothetical protein